MPRRVNTPPAMITRILLLLVLIPLLLASSTTQHSTTTEASTTTEYNTTTSEATSTTTETSTEANSTDSESTSTSIVFSSSTVPSASTSTGPVVSSTSTGPVAPSSTGSSVSTSTTNPTDNESTTSPNDSSTTSDSLGSTTYESSTTDVDNSSTTTTPPHGQCKFNIHTNSCAYEHTNMTCDPCAGVSCDVSEGLHCEPDANCMAACQCPPTQHQVDNGTCVSLCEPNPCQHDKECILNAADRRGFSCNCGGDYDGDLCQDVHDYCDDPSPPNCPKNSHYCTMHGVGNYSCECANGYVLDDFANVCIKVGQRISTVIRFVDTIYTEEYNNVTSDLHIAAVDDIQRAMLKCYNDSFISVRLGNFTQGSLVANIEQLNLKFPEDGDEQKNVKKLTTFINNCDNECFGENLKSPTIVPESTKEEDLRCVNEPCPEHTECHAVDADKIQCKCKAGFTETGTTTDNYGRPIESCLAIDFCASSPCTNGALCENTSDGNYTCTPLPPSPCDHNPCKGHAVCKPNGEYYDCECEWIYIATDCETPWPLILVILCSVFLFLLLLCVAALVFFFVSSRRGSSGFESATF